MTDTNKTNNSSKELYSDMQDNMKDLRFAINNSKIRLNESPAVLHAIETLQRTLDAYEYKNNPVNINDIHQEDTE